MNTLYSNKAGTARTEVSTQKEQRHVISFGFQIRKKGKKEFKIGCLMFLVVKVLRSPVKC